MTASLAELRAAARPLALALAFAPRQHQEKWADLLLFLLEMDRAVHLPAEALLAQIRLQWWADGLAGAHQDRAPLLDRLKGWQETGAIAGLADWPSDWQPAAFEIDLLPDLWGRYFIWMAAMADAGPDEAHTARTGKNLCMALQGNPVMQAGAGAGMRPAASHQNGFLAACDFLAVQSPDQLASPLLVWRLFFFMLKTG